MLNWSAAHLPIERLQRMIDRGDFSLARKRVVQTQKATARIEASDDDDEGDECDERRADGTDVSPQEVGDDKAVKARKVRQDAGLTTTESLKQVLIDFIGMFQFLLRRRWH